MFKIILICFEKILGKNTLELFFISSLTIFIFFFTILFFFYNCKDFDEYIRCIRGIHTFFFKYERILFANIRGVSRISLKL